MKTSKKTSVLMAFVMYSCSWAMAQQDRPLYPNDYILSGYVDDDYYFVYRENDQLSRVSIPLSTMGEEHANAIVKGSHVIITGKFMGEGTFSAEKYRMGPELLKGTFKKRNYNCPVGVEGRLTDAQGKGYDVISTVPLTDGQEVEVIKGAWGTKYCDEKMHQVYFIDQVAGAKSVQRLSGKFSSVRGVRHELSQYGFNIGTLTTRDGKGIVICFDKLRGGEELDIDGNRVIFVEGTYATETIDKDAMNDAGLQVMQDTRMNAKGEPETYYGKSSMKVLYVSKWTYQ